jgi:hypothetical protein
MFIVAFINDTVYPEMSVPEPESTVTIQLSQLYRFQERKSNVVTRTATVRASGINAYGNVPCRSFFSRPTPLSESLFAHEYGNFES